MFGIININKYYFSNKESLNDFIKINEDQVCYISTSTNKIILYVVILTFFNSNSHILARYFVQGIKDEYNMKDEYNIIFLKRIIANIYNSFITIAFSHFITNKTDYCSSFLILGYPNSKENTIDIIEEIKKKILL